MNKTPKTRSAITSGRRLFTDRVDLRSARGLRFQDLGLCPFCPELFIASSAFSLFTRTTLRFELALDLVRLRDSGCRLRRDRGNRWRYRCGDGLREADLIDTPEHSPQTAVRCNLDRLVERRARLLEQLGQPLSSLLARSVDARDRNASRTG